METMRILNFKVIEKGQHCYVIWPWKTPEAFLYEAFGYGCTYKLRPGIVRAGPTWLEIATDEGPIHGEYTQNLFYGTLTTVGWALYRQFHARGSHYLTQHGLDGVPKPLWEAAYEYNPGVPMGKVQFCFQVETARQGAFEMTFHDWLQYFVSGRNEHIAQMAVTKSER